MYDTFRQSSIKHNSLKYNKFNHDDHIIKIIIISKSNLSSVINFSFY